MLNSAKPPSPYLQQEAQLVYQQLKQAVGDQRSNFPELKILDRQLNAASYRQTDNSLILEKPVLHLCAKLGDQRKAALAFLLAHELTHFYQHQDWGKHTCWTQGTSLEAEADLHGAFLAYLAGYQVKTVAPQILKAIYGHYQLAEKLAHYPSLAERQKIVGQALQKLQVLQSVHQHAAVLLALGFHQEAFVMYEYLLKQLKTKELYNNAGVSLLSLAWSGAFSKTAFRYHYPIELHSELNLNPPTRTTQGLINTRQLLGMAKRNFEQAKVLAPNDFSVLLNLACTFNLLETADWDTIWNYISNAEKAVQSPLELSKLSLIKGIVYALQDKKALAIKEFSHARQNQEHLGISQLVEQNLKVLNKQPIQEVIHPFSKSKEQLDGLRLRNFAQLDIDYTLPLLPFAGTKSHLKIKYLPHSTLLIIPAQKQTVVIQSTTSSIPKTQQGIQVGDHLSKVQTTYANQHMQTLNMDNGYLLLLPSLRLFFELDNQQRIQRWGIYLKQVSS